MKKNTKIIIGIFLILAVSLIFAFRNFYFQEKSGALIKEEVPGGEVTLIIDFGEGEIKKFKGEIKEGETCFDSSKEGAEKLNLSLKTKIYDMGIFIEAIGDKENGQDGKYWLYYVNGELPMVACDKKEINPGDKIEWKFEKSPF